MDFFSRNYSLRQKFENLVKKRTFSEEYKERERARRVQKSEDTKFYKLEKKSTRSNYPLEADAWRTLAFIHQCISISYLVEQNALRKLSLLVLLTSVLETALCDNRLKAWAKRERFVTNTIRWIQRKSQQGFQQRRCFREKSKYTKFSKLNRKFWETETNESIK